MASLFRRLVWDGSVPLVIRIAPSSLPSPSSDALLDSYYVQAPRVGYLPLLLPELRRHLCELVLDEVTTAGLREDEWWFEADGGAVLKWHWPIGLIYDVHLTATSSSPSFPSSVSPTYPMQIILHLSNPPAEKLLLSPGIDMLKLSFMAQCKEADFLRWGSTKRMTGLRKSEQDGLWDGVREHNYDSFWRVASKIFPHPSPPSPSLGSNPPTPNPDGSGTVQSTNDPYAVRSVPMRLFLPDAPVIQDVYPPILEGGIPVTLGHILSGQLPLLFQKGVAVQNQNLPGAYALIQGIEPPLNADAGWLAASLAGADGWLNVCIGIRT